MAAKISPFLLAYAQARFLAEHEKEDRALIYQGPNGQQMLIFPEASRSRVHVQCDVPLTIEHNGELWDLVADLHSHHVLSIGPTFSSTDDANERIRGPIFGVCSWRDGWPPTWRFRRFDGQRFVEVALVVADG